jgi:cathepsin E
MFPKASLTALLTLAVAVSASPFVARDGLVSLSFAKKVNATSAQQLVIADRARAQALKSRSQASSLHTDAVVSSPATNAVVSYTAAVGVGSPATTCASPDLFS